MKKYNKLVRDRIPAIIKGKGEIAVTHIASEEEYRTKLKEKLREEVEEFSKDVNTDELADILEVVYALADSISLSREDLEKIRDTKARERGAFKERIILDEVQ
ncbi:MAG: nucleoside triphosphate pyrophosphohydrolase [Candidatus Jorgensenbacteria bacterium]|nr:nucleoside triphosphate pyrophosphohydrolase [Candidatus Jorgensenbacteria bacterium]